MIISSSSSLITVNTHHFDSEDLSFLLNKLNFCKSAQEIKQIHSKFIKSNPSIHTQQLIYAKFVSKVAATSTSIDLSYAHSLFDKLPEPDVSLYNAIIRCCSSSQNDNKSLAIAMSFYSEMLAKGLAPNSYTYPFLLKTCSQVRALREGEIIHGSALKTGFASDLYVANTLMRLYAVCGVLKNVRKVFDEIPQWDIVSWTTLIQGYVSLGRYRESIEVFFNMCDLGFKPDGRTMAVVLSSCGKLKDSKLGKKLHEKIRGLNVEIDVFVGNALIDMYLKCGEIDLSRQVFDKMGYKNVVSWNCMISGLARLGAFLESLKLFRKMQKNGLNPDSFTLVGVLNSCANLGSLESGKWVHSYLEQNRIKIVGHIGNSLIDMYSKCGSIDEAIRVFEGMKVKDTYTYTSMIVGLAINGHGERAIKLFSDFPKSGIEPNAVTYGGLLYACSQIGLVNEGIGFFKDMFGKHKIKPQKEHYGCLVDLLARSGFIIEAKRVIENMDIEPDPLIWGALLGACGTHGELKVAENIIKKIEKSEEEEKDGSYVLMSNIYSSSSKWREAKGVRKKMKRMKMRKNPGVSSIEVNGAVHEFKKGGKSHPRTREIYSLIEIMGCHLRDS